MNTIKLNVIGELTSSAEGGSGSAPIEKPIGVFIYTTDGEFITSDDWDSANNDKDVGVFVNDGEHDFVIAKENASSSGLRWGGYGKLIEGIPTISEDYNAKKDFDGKSNTHMIITELEGYNDGYGKGSPACEACANYLFIDGSKGYMPALGELYLAYINKSNIDTALTKCGGTTMDGGYWSSSQKNETMSYYCTWGLGGTYSGSKAYTQMVRAFCKI